MQFYIARSWQKSRYLPKQELFGRTDFLALFGVWWLAIRAGRQKAREFWRSLQAGQKGDGEGAIWKYSDNIISSQKWDMVANWFQIKYFSNIIQPIQDVACKQNLFIAIQLELNTLERNCWQWKLTKEVSATKRNVLSCKSGYSPDHPGVNRKYSGANCETDALLVTMKYALCSLLSRAAHYNEHKAW